MIRVCHLISGDLWAGAEIMAFSLLRELKKSSEIDVTAIVLNEGRLARELRNADVPVLLLTSRVFPLPHVVSRSDPWCKSCARMSFILTATRKISWRFWPGDFVGNPPLLPRSTECPREATSCLLSRGSFVSRLNKYLLARYFDRLVVVSDDMRQTYTYIQEPGFNPQKVHTIHKGA